MSSPSGAGAGVAAWRASLRIARRDAMRSRARSLLVVAMIALPVLGVVAADVLARSAELSPREKLSRNIGSADVALTDTRQHRLEQLPDGQNWTTPRGDQQDRRPLDLPALLPAGSRTIERRDGELRVRTAGNGIAAVQALELAYDDPIARGVVLQLQGRAPRTPAEVALTPHLADRIGVGVGGTVTVTDPARHRPDRSYAVVGLARRHDSTDDEVYGLPGALLPPGTAAEGGGVGGGGAAVLAATPRPVDWAAVRALNARGVLVVSRAVVLDPPPLSAQPASLRSTGGGHSVQGVALAVLAAGMALLEVVLLAGPAFAVGTRRQARQLALIGAVGGNRRHIRDSVLAGGVVLGGAGAAAGAVLGVGLAAALLPFAQRVTGTDPGRVDLRAPEIVGIALIGLFTGVAAALLPARTAARQDVWAALAGRRGTLRTSVRVPALGLVATATGTALALAGATRSAPGLLLPGCALAELGLVACTPTVVALVARAGRWLPAAPRLALRDAARHRARSGPAVAAILAAVAGSVAVAVYLASSAGQQQRTYQPQLPHGGAYVGLWDAAALGSSARITRDVGAALPLRRSYPVRTLDQLSAGEQGLTTDVRPPPHTSCPTDSSGVVPATAQADPRCRQFTYNSPMNQPVGDGATFTALTGSADRGALRVLAAGGVVAFNPTLVERGTVVLEVRRIDLKRPDRPPRLVRSVRVPAVALPAAPLRPAPVLVSPGAAHALGVSTPVAGIYFATTRVPTQREQDRAQAALAATGTQQTLLVERGYTNTYGPGLLALVIAAGVVTLGAAGIATGLAAADGRPDLATLAAIGASPAVRRRLAMAQAGTVAGLGTCMGVASGLVPGYAAVRTRSGATAAPGGGFTYEAGAHMALVVPWPTLLLLALAVPLLAVLGAGLCTRSRLPLVRRLE